MINNNKNSTQKTSKGISPEKSMTPGTQVHGPIEYTFNKTIVEKEDHKVGMKKGEQRNQVKGHNNVILGLTTF